MSNHHYVIYIPGLGDGGVHKSSSFQKQVIKLWRLYGVTPVLFQVNWSDSKPFNEKIERLLSLIDELGANGKVSLVCASAGATVALNAYAQRSNAITGVVCISGKINYSNAISSSYKSSAPSFWESSQRIDGKLARLGPSELQRVLSIRAMADLIVPARDSHLKGAHNRTAWTVGHALTIGTQLLFGAPFFIKFLKNQTTTNFGKS